MLEPGVWVPPSTERLLALGNTVRVWNRTPEKAAGAARAGASVSRSAGELASQSDALITMLTNAAAMEAVYLGPEGLLSGSVAGKLFIDMSTVRGRQPPRVGTESDGAGRGFPGVPGERNGRAGPGGQAGRVRRRHTGGLRPCQAVARAGLSARRVDRSDGFGANMKLAVNLVLTVFWQALAEAFSLVRSVHIEPARLIDLFADSNISARILRARGEQIAAALAGMDTGAATFDIDFMRKDMRDMVREAQSLGVSLPALARTLQAFDQASAAGYGRIDGTRYPAYWVDHVGPGDSTSRSFSPLSASS